MGIEPISICFFPSGSVIAATTFIESMTDVLSVLLLAATLFWTCVKIAKALKDGEE